MANTDNGVYLPNIDDQISDVMVGLNLNAQMFDGFIDEYNPPIYSDTITLTTGNWVASGDTTYPFKYVYLDSRISLQSWVDASLDLASVVIANAAGLCPATIEGAGGVNFYATTVPVSNLVVKLRIDNPVAAD